jgi:hypothetical protein
MPEYNTQVPQWEVPPSDREDGFECLVFYRGRWVHIKWSNEHERWSLPIGQLVAGQKHTFAPLPPSPQSVADFDSWPERYVPLTFTPFEV